VWRPARPTPATLRNARPWAWRPSVDAVFGPRQRDVSVDALFLATWRCAMSESDI
jgi:hypothetical protein